MLWSYAKDKRVSSQDLAIQLSEDELGTFRGMRVFSTAVSANHRLFRAEAHLDRIITAAHAIGMPPVLDKPTIAKLIQDTLAANPADLLMVRLVLSGCMTQAGIQSQFYMYVTPMPVYAPQLYQHGATLGTYPHQRPLAPVKLTYYVQAYLAKAQLGDSADYPLYITPDDAGLILEGDTYNIAFVHNNCIITPYADETILNGITRQCLPELAATLNMTYKEATIPHTSISQYTACFMTTSLRFIMPVQRINQVAFKIDPVRDIQAAFQAMFKSETGHHLTQLDSV